MSTRYVASPATVMGAEMVGVAVLWLLIYRLNTWLFSAIEFNEQVNWIFLPAALRVVAVLLFSWRGAAGLFLGAMLTYSPDVMGEDLTQRLALCAVSALAPLLAVWLTCRWLKTAVDLRGLDFGQLAWLCLAGAASSALAHTLLFMYQAADLGLIRGFLPMLAGDLLGTLLVVYAAHFAMRLWLPVQTDSRL